VSDEVLLFESKDWEEEVLAFDDRMPSLTELLLRAIIDVGVTFPIYARARPIAKPRDL